MVVQRLVTRQLASATGQTARNAHGLAIWSPLERFG